LHRYVGGCSVLEVGAGCGLLGMATAVMGARRVVLTDHPDAMPLLRRNVERNADVLQKKKEEKKKAKRAKEEPSSTSPVARCMPLDWEDQNHLDAVAALGPYDLILATDVVFSVKLVEPLLRCMRACAGPRTVGLCTR
jgi:predicted nicotinamide N-methyase